MAAEQRRSVQGAGLSFETGSAVAEAALRHGARRPVHGLGPTDTRATKRSASPEREEDASISDVASRVHLRGGGGDVVLADPGFGPILAPQLSEVQTDSAHAASLVIGSLSLNAVAAMRAVIDVARRASDDFACQEFLQRRLARVASEEALTDGAPDSVLEVTVVVVGCNHPALPRTCCSSDEAGKSLEHARTAFAAGRFEAAIDLWNRAAVFVSRLTVDGTTIASAARNRAVAAARLSERRSLSAAGGRHDGWAARMASTATTTVDPVSAAMLGTDPMAIIGGLLCTVELEERNKWKALYRIAVQYDHLGITDLALDYANAAAAACAPTTNAAIDKFIDRLNRQVPQFVTHVTSTFSTRASCRALADKLSVEGYDRGYIAARLIAGLDAAARVARASGEHVADAMRVVNWVIDELSLSACDAEYGVAIRAAVVHLPPRQAYVRLVELGEVEEWVRSPADCARLLMVVRSVWTEEHAKAVFGNALLAGSTSPMKLPVQSLMAALYEVLVPTAFAEAQLAAAKYHAQQLMGTDGAAHGTDVELLTPQLREALEVHSRLIVRCDAEAAAGAAAVAPPHRYVTFAGARARSGGRDRPPAQELTPPLEIDSESSSDNATGSAAVMDGVRGWAADQRVSSGTSKVRAKACPHFRMGFCSFGGSCRCDHDWETRLTACKRAGSCSYGDRCMYDNTGSTSWWTKFPYDCRKSRCLSFKNSHIPPSSSVLNAHNEALDSIFARHVLHSGGTAAMLREKVVARVRRLLSAAAAEAFATGLIMEPGIDKAGPQESVVEGTLLATRPWVDCSGVSHVFGSGCKEAITFVYGSTATGLGDRNSDIDIGIVFPRVDDDWYKVSSNPASFLNLFAAKLTGSPGFVDIEVSEAARIPVCRFVDEYTGLPVDVCCGNELAAYNTSLLRCVSKLDHRVARLMFAVKSWAKVHRLNDPRAGGLSSYAWCIMVLHYLRQPPTCIVPDILDVSIREDSSEDSVVSASVRNVRTDGTVRVAFVAPSPASNLRRATSTGCKQTVADLLHGFFCYFSFEFDLQRYVVDVRQSETSRPQHKFDHWKRAASHLPWRISIADPFDRKHDLGLVLGQDGVGVVLGRLLRAAHGWDSQVVSPAAPSVPWPQCGADGDCHSGGKGAGSGTAGAGGAGDAGGICGAGGDQAT